ncbi:MAG: ferritin-like domain-containing protein [Enhygromyxa sp.]
MSDPSTELLALRRHLRLALACAPVVLAAPLGCTDGASHANEQAESGRRGNLFGGGNGGGNKRSDNKPPDEDFLPTCPSGQWCGTKALVEPLRRTDEYAKKLTDEEGCPALIAGSEAIEERERYGELPMHGAVEARLDVEATKARRSAGEQDACCYDWMEMCPGGRPLLDQGRPQLASLRAGAGWTAALPKLDRPAIARLPAEQREAIAKAWLLDAQMEHSSIASFARARRELAAVGAPPSLLRGCKRAAADERRHARICFGIAAAYQAPALEPASLGRPPLRPGGLERVAIDTFIEGCVGETVAAACVRRAASEARDPALAQLLHGIADDEAEHAALAWQTLAWALERGGASIERAVAAVAEQLRPRAEDPPIELELIPAGHGRLDPRTRARVRRDAWAAIIDPLLVSLTPRGA